MVLNGLYNPYPITNILTTYHQLLLFYKQGARRFHSHVEESGWKLRQCSLALQSHVLFSTQRQILHMCSTVSRCLQLMAMHLLSEPECGYIHPDLPKPTPLLVFPMAPTTSWPHPALSLFSPPPSLPCLPCFLGGESLLRGQWKALSQSAQAVKRTYHRQGT